MGDCIGCIKAGRASWLATCKQHRPSQLKVTVAGYVYCEIFKMVSVGWHAVHGYVVMADKLSTSQSGKSRHSLHMGT